jgi:hypothetical protein
VGAELSVSLGRPPGDDDGRGSTPESLAEVLASIRALVSAETEARTGDDGQTVLMLTPEMRTGGGEGLAEGIGSGVAPNAPILDEESLREVINALVREELQGELGERINRNLRKLIRREVLQVLEEQRKS